MTCKSGAQKKYPSEHNIVVYLLHRFVEKSFTVFVFVRLEEKDKEIEELKETWKL
jgi:hypothetical protein